MLNKIESNMYSIAAVDILPKNVSQSAIEKVLQQNQSATGGLARILQIKVDARVMITVNIDIADRLTNGQIGIIKHVSFDSNHSVKTVYIKLDDIEAGSKKIQSDNFARQNLWVPLDRVEAKIQIKNFDGSPVIKRTQFPLMLSWACTVHKVQGLSIDRAVISFRLLKQRNFQYGQMYVALSRVTSLNGLFLTGEFKATAIKASPDAFNEYERMRLECISEPLPYNSDALLDSTLTITLLNTRSLQRHAIDIAHNDTLLNTDILCLTETQLLPNQNTDHISQLLNDFEFCHNCCEDKFQSISFCYKPYIEVTHFDLTIGASLVEFKKISFSQNTFRLFLVYRKNRTSLTPFYDLLTQMKQFNIHIFLVTSILMPKKVQTLYYRYWKIISS